MTKPFTKFILDEDGGIIVDWVVLTASTVGLAMLVLLSIGDSVNNVADQTAETVRSSKF